MTRRAAGRAGVRPCTEPPRGAGARHGAAVAACLGVALAALAGLPGPALAAPDGAGPDVPTTDRPVAITVTRLEPRTVTPGAAVTVGGMLTNTGDETFTGLTVRLQRGEVLDTRQELADDARDPGPASAASGPFQDVPGELEPGDSLAFSYATTAEELRLDEDGVFPVLVNVNGLADDGAPQRIGQLPSYLVHHAGAPAAPTAVAWLWPLVERPHRNAAGRFVDDQLAVVVGPDGRLDRALEVLEELPTSAGPAVPVTLAVDPALIEELTIMAAGPYAVDGEPGAGTGTDDAAAFLDRLRALADVHPVQALLYADADADALQGAGQAAALTRTLPGSPDGTARDPAVVLPPARDTPDSGDAGAGAGAAILRQALDVEAHTGLAWPAGGALRADTLATLADGGVGSMVLSEDAVIDGAAAVGGTGAAATARTTLSVAGRELTALVADSRVGQVVAAAEQAEGGPRIAEQRYLAELGVLAGQPGNLGSAVAQNLLVAAPRDIEADPEWATAMMADTAQLPWLRPASVEELFSGPVADTGGLRPRDPGAVALTEAGMADITRAVAVRDDLAGAAVDDPATGLARYDAAIARAASNSWRNLPTGFLTAAADLADTIDGLRGQVTLLEPAEGTYTLSSQDAPLVLTVRNDLPFAVQVRLVLRARGNAGLSTDEIGLQTLAPDTRVTLQVPARVSQSGSFAVAAQLVAPSGGPLGETVQLRVKSTAYGPVTLIITLGAGALLGLLFLRRLVRFLLRRRGSKPGPEDEAAAVGPPVPATRSPV